MKRPPVGKDVNWLARFPCRVHPGRVSAGLGHITLQVTICGIQVVREGRHEVRLDSLLGFAARARGHLSQRVAVAPARQQTAGWSTEWGARAFEKVGLTMLECTTETREPHLVYSQFVPPAVVCLRAVADGDCRVRRVRAFFASRNRRRDREYRRTAALMDALGLGRMVVAVARRGSPRDAPEWGASP